MNLISRLNSSSIFAALFAIVQISIFKTFHNINNAKILVCTILIISLSSLSLYRVLMDQLKSRFNLLTYLLLATPLISTLPGVVSSNGIPNYFFNLELLMGLVSFQWAVFLSLYLSHEGVLTFLKGMALTTIFICLLPIFGFKTSVFGHINYFSGFLNLLLPIFFCLALPNSSQEKMNKVFSVAALACFINIIFLYSRTVIFSSLMSIVLVVTLYLHFILKRKVLTKRNIGIVLLIFSFFITILLITNNPFSEKVMAMFRHGSGLVNRFLGSEVAIKAFLLSPIFGLGLGSYYYMYFQLTNPYVRYWQVERAFMHAHNEFAEILMEGGIVGFSLYLFFWIFLFVWTYQALKSIQNSQGKKIIIGIIIALIAYNFQSLFSVAPRKFDVKITLFTLLPILLLYLPVKKFNPLRKEFLAGILAVFLFLTFSTLRPFVPYLNSMMKLQNFMKEKSSPNYRSYKKSLAKTENIQGLYYLMIHQRQNQIATIGDTYEQINQIIPNYKQVSHLMALTYFDQNNYEKALEMAKNYQANDYCYDANTRLILNLAPKFGGKGLFVASLKQFTTCLFYLNSPVHRVDPNSINIGFSENQESMLHCSFTNKEPNCSWSLKKISRFFSLLTLTPKKRLEFFENSKNPPLILDNLFSAESSNRSINNYFKSRIFQLLYKNLFMTHPLRLDDGINKSEYLHRLQKALKEYL